MNTIIFIAMAVLLVVSIAETWWAVALVARERGLHKAAARQQDELARRQPQDGPDRREQAMQGALKTVRDEMERISREMRRRATLVVQEDVLEFADAVDSASKTCDDAIKKAASPRRKESQV